MIRPHPPRLRMKRRNTVSVTPAMEAKTVAGSIGIFPIITLAGTVATARAMTPASASTGFSQFLRTRLFYRLPQAMQLWHNLHHITYGRNREKRSARVLRRGYGQMDRP